jgi:hypothetical protein
MLNFEVRVGNETGRFQNALCTGAYENLGTPIAVVNCRGLIGKYLFINNLQQDFPLGFCELEAYSLGR